MTLMVIGVDPHKQSRTAVAADELGRRQAGKTVQARRDGHRELIARGRKAAPDSRLRAAEDVRHVAGGLIRELPAAGEQVALVPPQLMAGARAGGRAGGRERGKSDPIGALAIARAALREGDALPPAQLNDQVRAIRLLADHRDDLVAERTRAISQLRWTLHDPGPAPAPRALRTPAAATRLHAALAALPPSPARRTARSQLTPITTLTTETTAPERDLAALTAELVPGLPDIPGIAIITAARIIAETGDIRRFKTPAARARHNGTAPIPASSGNHHVHRLNPGGNRKINAAIHRAALTQARCHEPARQLLQRRKNAHETRKASLRVLKRHLSDAIYRALAADAHLLSQPRHQPQPHAA